MDQLLGEKELSGLTSNDLLLLVVLAERWSLQIVFLDICNKREK
jgi:hypothetical protein